MSQVRKIGLLDTTLREGEQTPGVNFTVEQREEIASRLSDAGIAMIEAGHPSVSPDVHEGVRRIVRLKHEGVISSEIIGHSRAISSDVETAASLDVDRIAIFYGVSDIHLASKTRKTREEALSIITEAISLARSHGVLVRFTPEDATRADKDYLREVVSAARDAGADRIGIADTVGIMFPSETKTLFQQLVSDIRGVEYDIHAHNDLGNAVANALSAVEGGATIVHCTVNGLGERVGITPTQVISVALKYHLGLDVANLDMMQDLSDLVSKHSGIGMPPNFPVTGEFAFVHKSGVHVAGILRNPVTYEFMDPSTIGRQRNFVIDKYTGRHALESRMKSLGVSAGEYNVSDLLRRIKSEPSTRQFGDRELLEMAGRVPQKSIEGEPA